MPSDAHELADRLVECDGRGTDLHEAAAALLRTIPDKDYRIEQLKGALRQALGHHGSCATCRTRINALLAGKGPA